TRRLPARAGIGGEKTGPVAGAEGDGAAAGGETAGVHVVGEPLRPSATAALEGRAAPERAPIEGGPAAVMAGGRAEEHDVPGDRDRPAVVSVQPVVLPPPRVPAI